LKAADGWLELAWRRAALNIIYPQKKAARRRGEKNKLNKNINYTLVQEKGTHLGYQVITEEEELHTVGYGTTRKFSKSICTSVECGYSEGTEVQVVGQLSQAVCVQVQPLQSAGNQLEIKLVQSVVGDVEPHQFGQLGKQSVHVLQLVAVQSYSLENKQKRFLFIVQYTHKMPDN
jgi:hypothetical protein